MTVKIALSWDVSQCGLEVPAASVFRAKCSLF